uniref:TFIIS N-terminal domain-containing protein n=1 Tax=Anopheles funestus TaxID=62324 RepID=A0A182RIM0_ANOFN
MDDSSADEAASIQTDPYVSDGAAKIIKNIEKKEANIVYLEDEEIIEDGSERDQFMTDFDIMRARKKAESVRRRKRNHNEASDENEDLVVELLLEMQQSATQDRLLNLDGKPATKKIAILHKVMHQLIKKDLQPTLLNHNVLHVLAEWITPLPNKALPCLQIRESVLKLLADFPTIDKFHLKQSGIGKAVMYLYKHPKETKANRKRANALIAEWFRSVFNISTDFSGMSREERRQRDLQQFPKQNKPSTPPDVVTSTSVVLPDIWMFETNKKTIRPGDKGWINRARVPLPSDKVYIVRPKSKIEVNLNSVAKKQPNRYEIYLKKFYDNKRKNSTRPPVPLSIGGAKFCDY